MQTVGWSDLVALKNPFPERLCFKQGGTRYYFNPKSVSAPMPRPIAKHIVFISKRLNGGALKIVEVELPETKDPMELIDKAMLIKVARGLAGMPPEWVEEITAFSQGELREVIEAESWDAVKPTDLVEDDEEPVEDDEPAEDDEPTDEEKGDGGDLPPELDGG